MNKLILSVFMLLAVSKSNGQKIKKDTTSCGSVYESEIKEPFLKYYPNRTYTGTNLFTDTAKKITISNNVPKVWAIINSGSDTLIILDTVIELYNNKIRYIKIGNKVYPLKTN